MAWVKLDDAMPHHPKIMAAGAQAFALDVAGICYSNKHATDGFIADHSLPAVFPGLSSAKRLAGKLVEVGRWYRVDGGWQIHDIHDYQPTAEHQKEVSKKRAEAGRRGGQRSKRSASSPDQADGKQIAKQVANEPDNPVPSRPEPQEPNPLPSDDGAEDQFERFWQIYPATNGRKPEKGKALTVWRRLTVEQRRRAYVGAMNLSRSDTVAKYAHRFLRKDTAGEFPFDDWQQAPELATAGFFGGVPDV